MTYVQNQLPTIMKLYARIINRLADKVPPDDVAPIVSHLLAKSPPENAAIYTACRNYGSRYLNENNDDFRTNGELRFMKERLVNSDVVFDVGANVGEWAALGLQINSGIQLHCFEPSHPTFEKLMSRHFPDNVTCNHFGLGSAFEEKTLHVFEEGAGHNSLYRRHGLEDGWNLYPQTRAEKIRLETLDRYCAQHSIGQIDFMKLDVEGHELEVFKGAKEALQAGNIKAIQFEYGGCNIDAMVLLKDMFEFFHSFEYSFFKIYPDGLRPIARYDQRLENFQYQNWAILRNE